MSNYETVPLGHLCEVKGGKRLPKGESYSSEQTEHPYLRVVDFVNRSIDTSDLRYINLKTHQKIARYTISSDDVYISIAGTIGITGTVPKNLSGANLTENAAKLVIRKPEVLNRDYLVHYLSTVGQAIIQQKKVATSQPKLALFRIEEIEIPLPPLSEQKRIAVILDKADAIRRKRQEARRVSSGLFKAAFYHTFGRDFLDRGDNVPLESLIDKKRGISYGVVQRGQHDPSGIPVARISNIVANVFDDSDFVRVSPEVSGKYKRTILNGGELLVSIRGTVGRTAIAPDWAAGWNVTREVAVIPLQSHVSRRFIHQLILTDEAQQFITGNVKGVAQRGINLKDLRQLPVPSLNSDAVDLFRSRIRRLESFYQKVVGGVAYSNDLFNSLVQRAFKGEL